MEATKISVDFVGYHSVVPNTFFSGGGRSGYSSVERLVQDGYLRFFPFLIKVRLEVMDWYLLFFGCVFFS